MKEASGKVNILYNMYVYFNRCGSSAHFFTMLLMLKLALYVVQALMIKRFTHSTPGTAKGV